MAHIKRIDLTRDVKAHEDAYREAIEKVCRETAFSGGKYADAFDKEFAAYVGSKYASGVNNGTSALHLAMLALGVGPGDEVIVPANTYIATAWGVSYTGATPVFADCTPDTLSLIHILPAPTDSTGDCPDAAEPAGSPYCRHSRS